MNSFILFMVSVAVIIIIWGIVENKKDKEHEKEWEIKPNYRIDIRTLKDGRKKYMPLEKCNIMGEHYYYDFCDRWLDSVEAAHHEIVKRENSKIVKTEYAAITYPPEKVE